MRNFAGIFAVCGLLALPIFPQAQTKPKPKIAPPTTGGTVSPTPSAVKLTYALTPGSMFRYRVTGLFNGHFPPFATSGGPPINLRVVIEFAGKVTKSDAKGAEVVFTVEKGDLFILQKEPGADGKSNPDDEIAFPIALSTVQKSLNATATLRPDGSIISVSNGDEAPVPISLGIDLRKLFLLTMPITFPDKPLKAGDEWEFKDGLLGQSEGKTTYKGKFDSAKLTGSSLASNVSLSASSKVEEKKTKDGKPTDKAEDVIETSVGTASVTGTMTYSGAVQQENYSRSDGGVVRQSPLITRRNLVAAMRLKQGKLTLTANIARTAPNPEKPEEKLTTPSDVKARLTVQQIPTKPAAKKAAAVIKENARR